MENNLCIDFFADFDFYVGLIHMINKSRLQKCLLFDDSSKKNGNGFLILCQNFIKKWKKTLLK